MTTPISRDPGTIAPPPAMSPPSPAAPADMSIVSEPARPSLGRLTLVELRKMTDTRAGRWLLIIVALIAVAVVGVVIFVAKPPDRTVAEMFIATQAGVGILLPILGVLSVTGEFSQRTTLTTFALVPGRHRVATAKLLAAAVLAATAVGVGCLAAWAGRALGGGLGRVHGGWGMPPELVGTALLSAVIALLMGVAFGLLFMNTPLAIVLSFVIPLGWAMLGEMISKLDGVANWLDQTRTLAPLTDPDRAGLTGEEWAKVGTTTALWLLLPLVAGLIRLTRRELK